MCHAARSAHPNPVLRSLQIGEAGLVGTASCLLQPWSVPFLLLDMTHRLWMVGCLGRDRLLHLCFELRDLGIAQLRKLRAFGSRKTSAVLHA